MTQDAEGQESLAQLVEHLPLERDVISKLTTAISNISASNTSAILERLESADVAIKLFWQKYNTEYVSEYNIQEISNSLDLTSSTRSGIHNLIIDENRIHRNTKEIRNFILNLNNTESLLFLHRYVEDLELYAYRTSDVEGMTNSALTITRALLRSVGRLKSAALEIAEKFVQLALRWQPNNPQAWVDWGACHVANTNYDAAKLIFLEGTRRAPGNFELAVKFALFLTDRVGNHALALKIVEEVLPYLKANSGLRASPSLATYFDLIFRAYKNTNRAKMLSEMSGFLERFGPLNAHYGLVELIIDSGSNGLLRMEISKILDNISIKNKVIVEILNSTFQVGDRSIKEFIKEYCDFNNIILNDNQLFVENYAKRYRKKFRHGRGFQFKIEDQVRGANLEAIENDIALMGKIRLSFEQGDMSGVRNYVEFLRHEKGKEQILSYARVLAIKGGEVYDSEDCGSDFAAAFEGALCTGNLRTLDLLALNYPRRESLCLLARSVFGDESAYDEIAARLSSSSGSL